jgi:hypothetical protein
MIGRVKLEDAALPVMASFNRTYLWNENIKLVHPTVVSSAVIGEHGTSYQRVCAKQTCPRDTRHEQLTMLQATS